MTPILATSLQKQKKVLAFGTNKKQKSENLVGKRRKNNIKQKAPAN